MCRFVHALAYLAFAGIGHRIEASMWELRGDSFRKRHLPIAWLCDKPDQRECTALKTLAVLSLLSEPTAAFDLSRPGVRFAGRRLDIAPRVRPVFSRAFADRPHHRASQLEGAGTSRRALLAAFSAAIAASTQPLASMAVIDESRTYDRLYYAPAFLGLKFGTETPKRTTVDSEFTRYEDALVPYFLRKFDEIPVKLPKLNYRWEVRTSWNIQGQEGRSSIEFTDTTRGLERDALNVYVMSGPLPGTSLAETPDDWFSNCTFNRFFSSVDGSVTRSATLMTDGKVTTKEMIDTPAGAIGPRRKLDITVLLTGNDLGDVVKRGVATVYEVDGAAVMLYATCGEKKWEKEKQYLERTADSFFVSLVA